MTTLYRPVLIESAEQAEALPEGTVATSEFGFAREKWCGGWAGADGDALYDHLHMLGWVALMPIEAEEETREHPTRVEERPESAYLQPVQQVRYKTRWESA